MDFYTNVRQYGNKLLVRSIKGDQRLRKEVPYAPYLFVKSDKGDYRTLFGDRAERMDFTDINDAKEFISNYSDVDNFHIYGMTQFVYPYINDRWPGEIKYDRDSINIMSMDIEVMSDDGFPEPEFARKEITVLNISDGKKFLVFGIKDYTPHQDNITYFKCKDEKELLLRFITEFKKMDPDIITGWNVEFFDIPYLINRIINVLGDSYPKELSPWGHILPKNNKDSGTTTYDIVGIDVMDYLAVYRKWMFVQQESYKLDHIASVELGEKKLDYSEYGSLHNFYEQNFQKYVEYNVLDTDLVNRIDDKLKLMDLALALAYNAKLNYTDAYTSVRMWDVIIHNYLIEKKIVIPQFKKNTLPYSIVGGHVKDPLLGLHKWVCSFDLNSLYPHLIMQYNISPEKFVEKINFPGCGVDGFLNGALDSSDIREFLHDSNYTITPNGCVWKRDSQGFLPALMEKMYDDRSSYKKLMLEAKQKYENTHDEIYLKDSIRYDKIQHAKKIQLNCAYGALANEWFRWFNPDHAESVTMGGQFSIRWIEKHLNRTLNELLKTDKDYVIASDTDSVYLDMSEFVDRFKKDADIESTVKYLDDICSKFVEQTINKSYERMAEYVNAFDQKMFMKREAIADKGIWTGKKHYILNVYNNEGVQYSSPVLKIMGIEAVRSSTPHSCRESIKEALKIIMNKDEATLIQFVEHFRREFNQLPYEEIAFPRGVNGVAKYTTKDGWSKGTPIHVRGSLVYNRLLEKHKLTNLYEKIRDGDKVKFCYLKMPNPAMENVISVHDTLPKELELKRYLDYDSQFEKNFLSPLRSITDVIGWELEKRSTLESFFG